MNQPRPLLQKLLSRKLLVALLAIGASLEHSTSTPHAIVLGVVAVVYIAAEAFIDRAGREQIFGDLVAGVTDGVDTAKRGLGEDDDEGGGPTTPLDPPKTPPLASPGAKRTLLPALAFPVLAFPVLALVVAIVACSRPPRPACGPEQLAKLEAEYFAEAVTTCKGRRASECAELPGIEARFEAKREEWARCR